jgi:hypothetical protein
MAALARELSTQGKTSSVKFREPDFNTPDFIKEAKRGVKTIAPILQWDTVN